MLCKKEKLKLKSSLPLPAASSCSHILIVVSRPQQRLHFNGFVIFKVRPEKVKPVTSLRFEDTEEVAFKEIDDIFKGSAIEWTFSALGNEVPIPVNRPILI